VKHPFTVVTPFRPSVRESLAASATRV